MKGSHAFLFDAPNLANFDLPAETIEAVPAEAEKPTSRVQIAKTGAFKHPRYGPLKVTRSTFVSFIANLPKVLAGGEAPIDFDHTPQLGGPTRACGWIKSLEVDGDRLFANVEWTWEGAWAIKDGAYKYFSPTWAMTFKLDDGTEIGPTLLGGGLTNYPFFNGLATVNLATFSRDDYEFAVEQEDEPSAVIRLDRTFALALQGLKAEHRAVIADVYARDPRAGLHALELLLPC